MQVISSELIKDKKVLLRLDLDVPQENGSVVEDFRLKVAIPTIKLCLDNASNLVVIGHIGRPGGKGIEGLKVAPIVEWFKGQGYKLNILENLRFDPREEACDLGYAKELAGMGGFYVNEAFSAYRPAVSTTILPTLLPHAAGVHFAEEVKRLTAIRESPKKPFICIMGGGSSGKDEEKFPVILVLAQKADAVLVGGKLVAEIREQNIKLPKNVMVGKVNDDGFDIAPETVESWRSLIMGAKMIVWNGPLGKFEDPKNDSTKKIGAIVVESGAETIVGGGDTISALNKAGLLNKFSFVSTGGGAMLKFLVDGILPTIEALK